MWENKLGKALRLLDEGQPERALPILEAYISRYPARVVAHVAAAKACTLLRHTEEAEYHWRNAHFILPNSPVILRALGLATGLQQAPPHPESTSETDQDREDTQGLPAVDEVSAELEAQAVSRSADQADPGEDRTDDLDQLIAELENARLTTPLERVTRIATPEEEYVPEIVSETLAQIYVAQNELRQAIRIYRQLAVEQPHRANEFEKRANRLERKLGNAPN